MIKKIAKVFFYLLSLASMASGAAAFIFVKSSEVEGVLAFLVGAAMLLGTHIVGQLVKLKGG